MPLNMPLAALACALAALAPAGPASALNVDRVLVERGRYLTHVAGCNDCHTPGYMQNGGPKLPEKDWLTGVPVGYQGPWGTTYAANLRLILDPAQGDADELAVQGAGDGLGQGT